MVVISDEVTCIFKILAMDVKNEQDLFSVLVPRDLLLRVDVEQELTLLIDSLKEKYKSSKLNCLHKNRDDKQKFPGINLVRQILRCNGYHLKPVIYSRGYCKHSGKKIVDRNFKIVRLDNYQEIKQAQEKVEQQIETKNSHTQKETEQNKTYISIIPSQPIEPSITLSPELSIAHTNKINYEYNPSEIKEIELNF